MAAQGRQHRVEAPGGVVPGEGFAPETAAETVDGQALELRWSETFAHHICWYEMYDMIRLGWVENTIYIYIYTYIHYIICVFMYTLYTVFDNFCYSLGHIRFGRLQRVLLDHKGVYGTNIVKKKTTIYIRKTLWPMQGNGLVESLHRILQPWRSQCTH